MALQTSVKQIKMRPALGHYQRANIDVTQMKIIKGNSVQKHYSIKLKQIL